MSRIARLAVSKAAAFGYAVAVGVAGNIAFNFVERQQVPVAAVMPALRPKPSAAAAARTAAVAPVPAAQSASAVQPMTPVALPAAPLPQRTPPTATPVTLPEPASAALPGPDTLPAPTLQPASLKPALEKTEAPSRPASTPAPAPAPSETAAPSSHEAVSRPATSPTAPAADAAASGAQPSPALPPLGPALVVAPPPSPPVPPPSAAPEVASLPPQSHADARPQRSDWQFSDIWHPARALRKGIDWAGDRLPFASASTPAPLRFPQTAPPAAPIPLVPQASATKTDAKAATPKLAAPGPGSGGLY
ncbi:MAG TPA: hypothetical protein VME41_06970 [Stellaceae bacterium]|nr:hypothetical protein [Stellaceae bacterium]